MNQLLKPGSIGLGLRPNLYNQIIDGDHGIDFLEIISENFMDVGGKPKYYLDQVREQYPILMHGVSLSLGGTQEISKDYLDSLKRLITLLKPQVVSDHLSWSATAHQNGHDLLPYPYTEQSLKHFCERLMMVQDYIGCSLTIENPSAYLEPNFNDMSEVDFINAVVEKTGVKILLDLNNLFVNHCNLGLDILNYLEKINSQAVAQIHLAGHTIQENVRIDTHDQEICDDVWNLFRLVSNRWPHVPTLIEWDDHFPGFDHLKALVQKAKQLRLESALDFGGVSAERKNQSIAIHEQKTQNSPLLNFQNNFLSKIAQPNPIDEGDEVYRYFTADLPVDVTSGFNVYHQAYFLRIRDVVKELMPNLYAVFGANKFNEYMCSYLKDFPPTHFDIKYVGSKIPEHLDQCELTKQLEPEDLILIKDVARIELLQNEVFDATNSEKTLSIHDLQEIPQDKWDLVRLNFCSAMRLIATSYDISQVFLCLENDGDLKSVKKGVFHNLIYRNQMKVHRLKIPLDEFNLLSALIQGLKCGEAIEQVSIVAGFTSEQNEAVLFELAKKFPEYLAKWCKFDLIETFLIDDH